MVHRSGRGQAEHPEVGGRAVRAGGVGEALAQLELAAVAYTAFGRGVAETHAAFDRPLARGLLRRLAGPGTRVAVQDPPEPTMSTHLEYMLGHTFTEWVSSASWAGWELPIVAWAESAGYELDYATKRLAPPKSL